MANRYGIILANTAVTSATTDEYPVALTNDLEGGLHHAATIADMEAIFQPRRRIGMLCYVESESASYQLVGGTTNAHWTKLSGNVVLIHQQNTPSSVWTINHNLFLYPTIESKVDDVWAKPTVTHPSDIQAVLTFAYPTVGFAQLR